MYILNVFKIILIGHILFFSNLIFAKNCSDFLSSNIKSISDLEVKPIQDQDSIYAAKVSHVLSKLNNEELSQLLKALAENEIFDLYLISEGQYIKNNAFYFSEDSLFMFFNGQLLNALQLRSGLIQIFPELEISVNAFFVPAKIDVQAVLEFFKEKQTFINGLYSKGSRNVLTIGHFTHYFKGPISSKSSGLINEIEINIYPGFINTFKSILKPKIQINKDDLEFQLDAIYRKAKFGQPIFWMD